MSGPTILITRPAGEADRTARLLAAEGFSTLLSPVLTIRRLPATPPAGAFAGLIATSVNGVEALADLTGERYAAHPFFIVGETTAETALRFGFHNIIAVAPDAEALSGQIIDALPAAAPLLYAAARDRAPTLEQRLAAAGAPPVILELYAADPARMLTTEAARALTSGTVAAVLHMSRRSAEAFLEAAEASGALAPALVVLHAAISAKAGEPLRLRGAERVAVAAEPTLASAIARLRAELRLGYATHSRETRLEE